MQIVIEIDEIVYEGCALLNRANEATVIEKAIANGTPLPEHHGRLIDADELLDTNIDTFSQQTELKIKYAPTIIEGNDSER